MALIAVYEGSVSNVADGANYRPVCSQTWSTIEVSELHNDEINKLSSTDYEALGELTVVVMLTAFAVRMVVQTLLTKKWEA